MTVHAEERLKQLGISLPEASTPAAKYANYVVVNGLMYVSGKGPPGQPRGKLGEHYTTEQGYEYARLTGIEVLAVLREGLGSLDKVKRVVKVQGFVNATTDYEEHHKVLNGFSDLMLEVFGDQGIHARSVFGAVSLRDQLPVIVDSIFQVEE
ncbi:RidA family protein [Virgibacillus sp. LDC1]|nr:RidA family protein [Virgibacillus sp. LDC1]